MLKIDPYIQAVENLIKNASSLSTNAKDVQKQPLFFQNMHEFFYRINDRSIALGESCVDLFDRIEKIPTIFSDDAKRTIAQKECHDSCLKAARVVIDVLKDSKSVSVQNQLHKLMQRVAALQYRIEACNGGLNASSVDPLLTDKLCKAALQWKENYSLIQRKQLSALDIKKLEEASRYPEFAQVLLVNSKLQESFFNWCLRDNNGVRQFVEFPATSERVKSVFIASRVGKLGSDLFKLEKRVNLAHGLTEKVISLPFFINEKKEYVSILDESKILALNNSWYLSINEIFKIFSRKNKVIGDLEFFGSTGIVNWNCHELGAWNPRTSSYDQIDLTQENFWKQLPVLDEVSPTVLESRLGIVLSEGEWVVSAKSARTTPDLDLDNRHGYLEVAIPTGKGTYAIYPFGNFASDFPNSLIDLVKFITNTMKGKISYPDENYFYSHRQQATCPMKITEEQGLILMNTIQKELIKARFGYVIFQFAGENCAYWAQNVLNSIDTKMPNFYKLDFLESKPQNPVLGAIFNCFRCLPETMLPGAIRTVDTLLGSGRGIEVLEYHKKVYKSHKQSPVRNEFVIYQPGSLHVQIEEGKIQGVISTGHC